MINTEIIYNQYSKRIYNLAYRMTGDVDDAHDITQETFIQAYNSIQTFKGESQIYTWLYQIAKNKCLRFLEKKNKTTFLSLQGLINNVSSPVSDEFSEAEKLVYISQVKEGCLSGLIRCLSIQQRLAFILHILLEMPIDQVAIVIDKSENAARILVHRAKQNIKEFLCNNCSLYHSKNSCRCENLVNFSLKQGWIGLNSELNNHEKIETEIKDLKSMVSFYNTLPKIPIDEDLTRQIKKLLAENQNFIIFNDKKVK
jgi:RNA polymerase sigma factor (sigma-70 family)